MAGIWCICRNKKYPVRRELRFANKLVFPGCTVTLETAKMANRILAQMTTPEPPGDVERRSIRIPSEDGDPVRVMLYRPVDLKGDTPCLVYFHGGGFCVGDEGHIHHYAIQYAKGAECVVALVHYRTSDIAPFPAPFQDCYTTLSWVLTTRWNFR